MKSTTRARLAALAAPLLLSAPTTESSEATSRAGVTGSQEAPRLDSARVLRDLSILAADSMEGRAAGTPGNALARAYLVRTLAEAGATPLDSSFEHRFAWDDRSGANVIGSIRGTEPDNGVIVLTAHYDHVGIRQGQIFNGADDNASGVAAAVEIARRIAEAPLPYTLIVALLDAEETGLRGARAFVTDPPVALDRVELNVNLDMVARTGGVLWASGAHHTPSLRPILEQVAETSPVRLRLGHDRPGAPEGDDWTFMSDHGPFHEAGIPFVYFGVEDHPDYHRATDDFERIDPGEYIASIRAILEALRALADALPLSD